MKIEQHYTTSEVCKLLKISERTIRRYIKDGTLSTVKIGSRHKISETNLKYFIQNSKYAKKIDLDE